jgi:DNA-binding MarR family transcriptional regulator
MATLPITNLPRAKKEYKGRRESRTIAFRSLYRFDEENVLWLSEHFIGESSENRGGALTPKQHMLVFLRYMADPGFQKGVAEDIGIDQTTVSKTVHKVK